MKTINFTSKTFWTGLGLVGFGIYSIIEGNVDEGLTNIMQGLGFIFLRAGVEKLK